ncbi:MAG: hypothetical protein K2Q09_00660 [Phycisphaerales bacterium]|nr:hypothetical protein [Phycisphaerales bacterium]
MRKGVCTVVGLVVAAATAVAGGCSDNVRQQALWDPSAAEAGPVTTPEQINNGMAHTWDTNSRLLLDDLGRFWLMDRPSRMTPYPIR